MRSTQNFPHQQDTPQLNSLMVSATDVIEL